MRLLYQEPSIGNHIPLWVESIIKYLAYDKMKVFALCFGRQPMPLCKVAYSYNGTSLLVLDHSHIYNYITQWKHLNEIFSLCTCQLYKEWTKHRFFFLLHFTKWLACNENGVYIFNTKTNLTAPVLMDG